MMHKRKGTTAKNARLERIEGKRLCVVCETSKQAIEESGQSIDFGMQHGEFPHPFVPMDLDRQKLIQRNRNERDLPSHVKHMCAGKSDESCPFPSVRVCHAADGRPSPAFRSSRSAA